jgi:hypothetical protein
MNTITLEIKTLKSMASLYSFSDPKDTLLSTVQVVVSDNDITAYATDKFKLIRAVYDLTTELKGVFFIDAATAKFVKSLKAAKYLPQVAVITWDSETVSFEFDGQTFTARNNHALFPESVSSIVSEWLPDTGDAKAFKFNPKHFDALTKVQGYFSLIESWIFTPGKAKTSFSTAPIQATANDQGVEFTALLMPMIMKGN